SRGAGTPRDSGVLDGACRGCRDWRRLLRRDDRRADRPVGGTARGAGAGARRGPARPATERSRPGACAPALRDRPRGRRRARAGAARADRPAPGRGRSAARGDPGDAARHARPAGTRAAGEACAPMKCPTCGYIGFEAADRCRNCGYDFTMAAPARTSPDLPLRTEDSEGVLRDLDLAMPPANRGGSEPQPDLDRVMSSLDRVLGGPEASDLPLFESE